MLHLCRYGITGIMGHPSMVMDILRTAGGKRQAPSVKLVFVGEPHSSSPVPVSSSCVSSPRGSCQVSAACLYSLCCFSHYQCIFQDVRSVQYKGRKVSGSAQPGTSSSLVLDAPAEPVGFYIACPGSM